MGACCGSRSEESDLPPRFRDHKEEQTVYKVESSIGIHQVEYSQYQSAIMRFGYN